MLWNLVGDLWVSWSFFYKTTIIRQLTKCKLHFGNCLMIVVL